MPSPTPLLLTFFDHSNIIPFKTCSMMISAPITGDDMVSQLRSFFDKEEKQKGPRGVDSLAFPHLMAYSPIKDDSDWTLFTIQQLVEELNRISKEGKESRIQDLWGFGMDRIEIKSWVYRPITEQRETIRPSPIMIFWSEGHVVNFALSEPSTAELETILRGEFEKPVLKWNLQYMMIMTSDERTITFIITRLVDEINRIVKDKTLVGDAASLYGFGVDKVAVFFDSCSDLVRDEKL